MDQFRKVYELNQSTKKDLDSLINTLDELKDKLYTPELKEIESNSVLHEDGRITFTDRWKLVSNLAYRYNIGYKQYSNLQKLVESLKLEKDINFNTANKERDQLIDELSKKLDKEQLEGLVLKSLAFKTNKITQSEYYTYLQGLADKANIDPVPYRNLINYTEYITIYESIDLLEIFNEVKAYEDQIIEKLYTTEEQRKLHDVSKCLSCIKGLFNLKLTNTDFEYLEKAIKACNKDYILTFLNHNLTGPVREGYNLDTVFDNLDTAMEFYRTAEQRNRAILANTIKRMDAEGTEVAALITGGYHTKGLSDILKRKETSYLVILPKFDASKGQRPYVAILTNKNDNYSERVNAFFKEIVKTTLDKAYNDGKDIALIKKLWKEEYRTSYEKLVKEDVAYSGRGRLNVSYGIGKSTHGDRLPMAPVPGTSGDDTIALGTNFSADELVTPDKFNQMVDNHEAPAGTAGDMEEAVAPEIEESKPHKGMERTGSVHPFYLLSLAAVFLISYAVTYYFRYGPLPVDQAAWIGTGLIFVACVGVMLRALFPIDAIIFKNTNMKEIDAVWKTLYQIRQGKIDSLSGARLAIKSLITIRMAEENKAVRKEATRTLWRANKYTRGAVKWAMRGILRDKTANAEFKAEIERAMKELGWDRLIPGKFVVILAALAALAVMALSGCSQNIVPGRTPPTVLVNLPLALLVVGLIFKSLIWGKPKYEKLHARPISNQTGLPEHPGKNKIISIVFFLAGANIAAAIAEYCFGVRGAALAAGITSLVAMVSSAGEGMDEDGADQEGEEPGLSGIPEDQREPVRAYIQRDPDGFTLFDTDEGIGIITRNREGALARIKGIMADVEGLIFAGKIEGEEAWDCEGNRVPVLAAYFNIKNAEDRDRVIDEAIKVLSLNDTIFSSEITVSNYSTSGYCAQLIEKNFEINNPDRPAERVMLEQMYTLPEFIDSLKSAAQRVKEENVEGMTDDSLVQPAIEAIEQAVSDYGNSPDKEDGIVCLARIIRSLVMDYDQHIWSDTERIKKETSHDLIDCAKQDRDNWRIRGRALRELWFYIVNPNGNFMEETLKVSALTRDILNDMPPGARDPLILFTDTLTPRDLNFILERYNVQAIATHGATMTSHWVVYAGDRGIPVAIIGGDENRDYQKEVSSAMESIKRAMQSGRYLHKDINRRMALIGGSGEVVIGPHLTTVEQYLERLITETALNQIEAEDAPEKCAAVPVGNTGCVTSLRANADSVEEIKKAKREYSAAGVGLFRTEYLFSGAENMIRIKNYLNAYFEAESRASEESENRLKMATNMLRKGLNIYFDEMAQAAGEDPVKIRMIDFESDKITEIHCQLADRKIDTKKFGMDFYRTKLGRAILLIELEAALRSYYYSAKKNIKIIFPMVRTLDDAGFLREIFEEAKDGMAKGIGRQSKTAEEDVRAELDLMPVEFMIEHPDAVDNIEAFVRLDWVTGFSIGTNDLWCYVLSRVVERKLNRDNHRDQALLSRLHPECTKAITKVIAAVRDENRRQGRPAKELSFCGELASHENFLVYLAWQMHKLGIAEEDLPISLSMAGYTIRPANIFLRNISKNHYADSRVTTFLRDGADEAGAVPVEDKARRVTAGVMRKIYEKPRFRQKKEDIRKRLAEIGPDTKLNPSEENRTLYTLSLILDTRGAIAKLPAAAGLNKTRNRGQSGPKTEAPAEEQGPAQPDPAVEENHRELRHFKLTCYFGLHPFIAKKIMELAKKTGVQPYLIGHREANEAQYVKYLSAQGIQQPMKATRVVDLMQNLLPTGSYLTIMAGGPAPEATEAFFRGLCDVNEVYDQDRSIRDSTKKQAFEEVPADESFGLEFGMLRIVKKSLGPFGWLYNRFTAPFIEEPFIKVGPPLVIYNLTHSFVSAGAAAVILGVIFFILHILNKEAPPEAIGKNICVRLYLTAKSLSFKEAFFLLIAPLLATIAGLGFMYFGDAETALRNSILAHIGINVGATILNGIYRVYEVIGRGELKTHRLIYPAMMSAGRGEERAPVKFVKDSPDIPQRDRRYKLLDPIMKHLKSVYGGRITDYKRFAGFFLAQCKFDEHIPDGRHIYSDYDYMCRLAEITYAALEHVVKNPDDIFILDDPINYSPGGPGAGRPEILIACEDRPGILGILTHELGDHRISVDQAFMFRFNLEGRPGKVFVLLARTPKIMSGQAGDEEARISTALKDIRDLLHAGADGPQVLQALNQSRVFPFTYYEGMLNTESWLNRQLDTETAAAMSDKLRELGILRDNTVVLADSSYVLEAMDAYGHPKGRYVVSDNSLTDDERKNFLGPARPNHMILALNRKEKTAYSMEKDPEYLEVKKNREDFDRRHGAIMHKTGEMAGNPAEVTIGSIRQLLGEDNALKILRLRRKYLNPDLYEKISRDIDVIRENICPQNAKDEELLGSVSGDYGNFFKRYMTWLPATKDEPGKTRRQLLCEALEETSDNISLNGIMSLLHSNYLSGADSGIVAEEGSEWELSVVLFDDNGRFMLSDPLQGAAAGGRFDRLALEGIHSKEELFTNPLISYFLAVIRESYYLDPRIGWITETRQGMNERTHPVARTIRFSENTLSFNTYSIRLTEGVEGGRITFCLKEGPLHAIGRPKRETYNTAFEKISAGHPYDFDYYSHEDEVLERVKYSVAYSCSFPSEAELLRAALYTHHLTFGDFYRNTVILPYWNADNVAKWFDAAGYPNNYPSYSFVNMRMPVDTVNRFINSMGDRMRERDIAPSNTFPGLELAQRVRLKSRIDEIKGGEIRARGRIGIATQVSRLLVSDKNEFGNIRKMAAAALVARGVFEHYGYAGAFEVLSKEYKGIRFFGIRVPGASVISFAWAIPGDLPLVIHGELANRLNLEQALYVLGINESDVPEEPRDGMGANFLKSWIPHLLEAEADIPLHPGWRLFFQSPGQSGRVVTGIPFYPQPGKPPAGDILIASEYNPEFRNDLYDRSVGGAVFLNFGGFQHEGINIRGSGRALGIVPQLPLAADGKSINIPGKGDVSLEHLLLTINELNGEILVLTESEELRPLFDLAAAEGSDAFKNEEKLIGLMKNRPVSNDILRVILYMTLSLDLNSASNVMQYMAENFGDRIQPFVRPMELKARIRLLILAEDVLSAFSERRPLYVILSKYGRYVEYYEKVKILSDKFGFAPFRKADEPEISDKVTAQLLPRFSELMDEAYNLLEEVDVGNPLSDIEKLDALTLAYEEWGRYGGIPSEVRDKYESIRKTAYDLSEVSRNQFVPIDRQPLILRGRIGEKAAWLAWLRRELKRIPGKPAAKKNIFLNESVFYITPTALDQFAFLNSQPINRIRDILRDRDLRIEEKTQRIRVFINEHMDEWELPAELEGALYSWVAAKPEGCQAYILRSSTTKEGEKPSQFRGVLTSPVGYDVEPRRVFIEAWAGQFGNDILLRLEHTDNMLPQEEIGLTFLAQWIYPVESGGVALSHNAQGRVEAQHNYGPSAITRDTDKPFDVTTIDGTGNIAKTTKEKTHILTILPGKLDFESIPLSENNKVHSLTDASAKNLSGILHYLADKIGRPILAEFAIHRDSRGHERIEILDLNTMPDPNYNLAVKDLFACPKTPATAALSPDIKKAGMKTEIPSLPEASREAIKSAIGSILDSRGIPWKKIDARLYSHNGARAYFQIYVNDHVIANITFMLMRDDGEETRIEILGQKVAGYLPSEGIMTLLQSCLFTITGVKKVVYKDITVPDGSGFIRQLEEKGILRNVTVEKIDDGEYDMRADVNTETAVSGPNLGEGGKFGPAAKALLFAAAGLSLLATQMGAGFASGEFSLGGAVTMTGIITALIFIVGISVRIIKGGARPQTSQSPLSSERRSNEEDAYEDVYGKNGARDQSKQTQLSIWLMRSAGRTFYSSLILSAKVIPIIKNPIVTIVNKILSQTEAIFPKTPPSKPASIKPWKRVSDVLLNAYSLFSLQKLRILSTRIPQLSDAVNLKSSAEFPPAKVLAFAAAGLSLLATQMGAAWPDAEVSNVMHASIGSSMLWLIAAVFLIAGARHIWFAANMLFSWLHTRLFPIYTCRLLLQKTDLVIAVYGASRKADELERAIAETLGAGARVVRSEDAFKAETRKGVPGIIVNEGISIGDIKSPDFTLYVEAIKTIAADKNGERLRRFLNFLKNKLQLMDKFNIDKARKALDQLDDKDIFVARMRKALTGRLIKQKELLAQAYNNMILSESPFDNSVAVATTDEVAESDIFFFDNVVKASEQGIVSPIIYGSTLKDRKQAEEFARAGLKTTGFSEDRINKAFKSIVFVDKYDENQIKRTIEGLVFAIRAEIRNKFGSSISFDRIGIRAIEKEVRAGDERPTIGKLLEIKPVKINGMDTYVAINTYQVLLEVVNGACLDGKIIPGLSRDEKGVYIYLSPIVPHDYNKEIGAYRDAIVLLASAA
ncbi:MAG: putative PEP-binding protein [Candidatus Omnitrophota bacterium]